MASKIDFVSIFSYALDSLMLKAINGSIPSLKVFSMMFPMLELFDCMHDKLCFIINYCCNLVKRYCLKFGQKEGIEQQAMFLFDSYFPSVFNDMFQSLCDLKVKSQKLVDEYKQANQDSKLNILILNKSIQCVFHHQIDERLDGVSGFLRLNSNHLKCFISEVVKFQENFFQYLNKVLSCLKLRKVLLN